MADALTTLTTPTTLTTLTAIERLLASYPLLFDSGDIAGCVEVFVENCVFAVAGNPPVEGRDALRRFFQNVHDRGAAGIHLPGPALIDVAEDGTSATMWQSFLFVANGSNTISRGMYRDVAVLEGDRWRFRRRDIELYPGRDRRPDLT